MREPVHHAGGKELEIRWACAVDGHGGEGRTRRLLYERGVRDGMDTELRVEVWVHTTLMKDRMGRHLRHDLGVDGIGNGLRGVRDVLMRSAGS